ncbi:ABC-F family ATPase [Klebsiella pneumoniae]|uniref:ABC-F family ATPase n=1 Tax=Klebsiella pneumoniae TaxID=573 RepID=UPI0008F8BDE2|nr:ABC-F family ATPase [Klebsiella pneumoniae]
MIVFSSLQIRRGVRVLLDNATATINPGQKVGLVGKNGCGKSTLLSLLKNEISADGGSMTYPGNWQLAWVNQETPALPQPAIDYVIDGDREYRQLEAALQQANERNDGHAIATVHGKLDAIDAWTIRSRAASLLHGLGFSNEQLERPVSDFSGGWRMRLNLAQALICRSDLLLLDEPTNNLDIDTIRWLEQTLNDRDSTMIIISHDRHFLNMVCTHMADLDYGELRVYPGNYDEYMTAATQARERLLADNAKKKAQIADLQSFVSRFSANASKSRQATSRARQIDKIKLEEVKASSRQNPFIRFEQDKKLFRNALEVEALTKGFDEGPLFKNVNLLLEVGEKIAILGANGVGKSTMLKTLVGELQPDNGSVKWSENAQIGYYAQDHEYEFENDLTVFEWMSQWKQEGDDEQAVRSILGRLLFSQDDIKKPAKVLSGGEKGRMLFGKLMMQKPNILVMDEPTNHLDMESIESLNMALEMYQGTLIFVSHDREFVSSLATRVLEITPDRVIDFSGNYEDYLRSKGIE